MVGGHFYFKIMIHVIEHTLGLCGEKHISLIAAISEWQNLVPIFNYIKTLFK